MCVFLPMCSTKCNSLVTWAIGFSSILCYTLTQGHIRYERVDRYKRELTTMLPEIPQGDMNMDGPLVPVTDPCYPFVNVSNHVFYSPGYPAETYTNNTECVVVLQAPEGNLIRLDFRDWFEIEPSPGCKNDFLEVRDGPHGYNTRLKPPFCGYDFPPMLTSSDRHLWIHFKSDDSIERRGFKAVYDYIPRHPSVKTPEILPCRLDLTDLEEGVFGRKDIPQEILDFITEHDMPIDCVWAISVRDKWRIQLQFQKFALEKPNDCDSNFVEVFSDRTDMDSLEKTFCGSIADTVNSKHNVMFVRFFSESKGEKTFFEANFTAFRDRDKKKNKEEEGCEEGEFDCDDATCISDTLKCNGRFNCRFRWDEEKCENTKTLAFGDNHMIIIMVIFSLILAGMFFTFLYNCVRKIMRDHRTIQEYINQSREQQLNELDKEDQLDKILPSNKSHSRSRSLDSRFSGGDAARDIPCYVPETEDGVLPVLIRNESSPSRSVEGTQDIYAVDNEDVPEMCDSACQTRESLFTTQGYSSGNSSPKDSVHNSGSPPPAPGFIYGNSERVKFKAEAKIEMGGQKKGKLEERRRPYSVCTTKSAPDVIVTL